MKISKDVWHYKWVASKWDYRPSALCWYFWKLVLTMIWWTVIGVLGTLLGMFAIVVLTIPFWQWLIPDFGDLVMSVVSALMWIAIGSVILYHYREYLYESGQLKQKIRPYKEPGIVSQYIHAKHRKICPLLEYER